MDAVAFLVERKKSLEKIREWLAFPVCAFSKGGGPFDSKIGSFPSAYGLDYHCQTRFSDAIEKQLFCVSGKKKKEILVSVHRSSLGHSADESQSNVCIMETFGFGMLRANRHIAPHFSLLGRHPILPRLSGDRGSICIIQPPAIGQFLRWTCADSDRVPRRISG